MFCICVLIIAAAAVYMVEAYIHTYYAIEYMHGAPLFFVLLAKYAALGTALFRVMKEHPDATFRVPYGLGCGLAGGNWVTVLNLIEEAANAWNVNVEIWVLPKK